ncbi:TraM-binding TraD/TraG-like protein [Actinokineospora cianjurensis]|uniref:TraM-binding TraD/TraG-like protein n=2 Tax=Actinokineospora cianjurensis TaxID=585224 RepID=A0A421BC64_9PSEU|nr:TraM-binding TraD/TraG-like protein [Actinokineospora cianjurensis]
MNSWLGRYLRDPFGAMQLVLAHLRAWAIVWGPIAGPALVIAVTVLVAVRRRMRERFHQRLVADARVITILAPPVVDPHGATALWSNLLGLIRPGWRRALRGQPHLAFEYRFRADQVDIRIWVPGVIPPGMVERAIEAAWPGAHTSTTPANPPLTHGTETIAAGGELRLARHEGLPLRVDHPVDPIRALLGAPVGMAPGEQACVQILARPVAGRRVTRARAQARRLHPGRSSSRAGRILDLITPGARRRSGARSAGIVDAQSRLEFGAQDRAIVDKLRGAQWETRVRYAVTTTAPTHDPDTVTAARAVMAGRAHAIASAFAAYSGHNRYRRARLTHPATTLAARRMTRGDLLSVPELAALAHLPTDDATPGLQRAGARAVPPPPGIPTTGELIKPIGRSDSGHSRPVGLHVADARHHVHILGATGSGKSELMARMILADAEAGRGVVVIDPKGDLVNDILARLPEHLGPKVTLFDADSRTRPPVINPLQGADRERTVDNLVSIFSRIYSSSWGPRTEDILRSGLLTLTSMPGTPGLIDLPGLLTVDSTRARAIAQIDDPVLAGFWQWYDSLSESYRAQIIAPLMNKLRGLLLRPFVRSAIAEGQSTVDFDAVLDGGICLVRIGKDALGIETARLMGSIVVAQVWQAATRRARLPQHHRRDASVYLDEVHNFMNLPFSLEDMLAEFRGYRVGFALAHQFLSQLARELEEAISANARTKLILNSSPEDARKLARHTAPRVTEHDLSHLDVFHIVARLVVNGAETPAFTAVTEKLPPAIPGRARTIRAAARNNNQPPAPRTDAPQRTQDPRHAA